MLCFKVCLGSERIGAAGFYDVITKSSGMTWYEAYNYCTDMGKALLAIASTEENEAVERFLQQNEGK